jgi:hypothetical protein
MTFFFFEFELRASHLLSRHSTTWLSHTPGLVCTSNINLSLLTVKWNHFRETLLIGIIPTHLGRGYWGLNSELYTCKVGILPLEPHFQSILLWLFWRWGLANYFSGWPPNVILLISASQVARTAGMSHQHLALRILNEHSLLMVFFQYPWDVFY